jgi:REP element-mobilizing transposase RayT
MKPVCRTPQPERHHLPRLAPDRYRAFTVVHWTITLEDRATGWLDGSFHAFFRELLLHAAARAGLLCPCYVLMPDHLHLVWMGLRPTSDQRNAMRFLRKNLAVELARQSSGGTRFLLQKQAHDHVLREQERLRGAVAKVCFYVLDNPRRKGLVSQPSEWPFLGAMVPGYPFLHPLAGDFWKWFWGIYEEERQAIPAERPSSNS